ncbi:MAG: hypothetical protein Q8905_04450 [Bacteroidota bacterium]|nr:hypothetical protein [Bacteroidota bacterium]
MKMGVGIFWGIFFILLGLGIVIKIIFHVDIPVFKIFIALFLIYVGIKMLVGNPFHCHNHFYSSNKNDVIFEDTQVAGDSIENAEHNVIFGSAIFDLQNTEIKKNPSVFTLHTVFGKSVVKLKKGTPLKVEVNTAFAGVNLPNGNTTVLGNSKYVSDSLDVNKNYLFIKADVVFGGLDIVYE